MLLIFTLRRPDVFQVDDFGVREGYRLLHGLAAQPKPKAFADIGKAYAPHRTLASLYLWRAADEVKKPGTVLSKDRNHKTRPFPWESPRLEGALCI